MTTHSGAAITAIVALAVSFAAAITNMIIRYTSNAALTLAMSQWTRLIVSLAVTYVDIQNTMGKSVVKKIAQQKPVDGAVLLSRILHAQEKYKSSSIRVER